MPCNTCDKDSGKFYGGSCPECLAERVRELETSNASLIGAVDGLIIESVLSTTAGRDLLKKRDELEASCAVMRDALDFYAHTHPSCAWKYEDYGEQAKQALSTTAGREFLARLEKLERVAEARREDAAKYQKWWQDEAELSNKLIDENRELKARLKKLERVADAIREDVAGESVEQLLLTAADILAQHGGGPVEDRLRHLAAACGIALVALDGDGNG